MDNPKITSNKKSAQKLIFRPRRSAAAICALWISFASVANAGGLDSMLEGMFTQITNPSVYESQSRMGLVGGSLTMRVPTKQINILSFDPPRFNAGCGGVDIYFGSFSFVSKQELTQLFRQLVQAAPAVLFKMAIDFFNPQLGTLMQEFQEKIQALNSMLKNSCQIVAGFADAGFKPGAIADKAAEIGKAFSAVGSSGARLLDGALFGSKDSDYGKTPKSVAVNSPKHGNLVWRAMHKSGAVEKVGFPSNGASASDQKSLVGKMILNITGSTSIPTSETTIVTSCPADNPGCTLTTPYKWPGNKLTVQMLIAPDDSATLVGCGDSEDTSDEFACQTTSSNEQKLISSFKGTAAFVNKALFGLEQPVLSPADMASPTGGFVDAILKGRTLTNPEKLMLSQLPLPVFRHLLVVQRDKAAVVDVASKLASVMAEQMAVALADSLIQAAKQSWGGQIHVEKPEDIERNLAAFERNVNVYRADAAKRMRVELDTANYVRAVAENNMQQPAAIGSANGR